MRNLKKILALVLALVMSMSLLATANAFSDSDKIDPTYNEAVEVLNGLGVFKGRTDGNFDPKAGITRAEVAAIIYRIVTGDVTDKQVALYADYNKFADVKSGSWYAGYVNFCANGEYIKGYPNGTFGPNDAVTGYQALAMILRAVGYDKNGEFTGKEWQTQTAAVAKSLGITNNIIPGTLGTAASRETVAEILFRAILVPTVAYTPAFGYQSTDESLGMKTFKLEYVKGVVTANEYADLYGSKAKAEGKTEMQVGDDDRTLAVSTSWDALGETHYAYVTDSKVLYMAKAGDTVFETGAEADISTASKFAKVTGMSDDAEHFINFDRNDEGKYETDIRIVYSVTGKDADKVSIAAGKTLTQKNYDDIKDIFTDDDLATGWVVVGTKYNADTAEKDDVSNEMTFKKFVKEYLTTTNVSTTEVEGNENGNWLKVIDNDGDGKADYVLKVVYTAAGVADIDRDDDIELSAIDATIKDGDEVNIIDEDIPVVSEDELAEGDVVYYALVDGKAHAYKAEVVTAKIDKVNRNKLVATTTDGEEYTESGVHNHIEWAGYEDGVRELAGNISYDLFLDRFGYLMAFTQSATSGEFALLVDGYYESDRKGDVYGALVWNGEELVDTDITENGDLFISDNSNDNDWDNLKAFDGINNDPAKDSNEKTKNEVNTIVAALSEDGVLTPVEDVYNKRDIKIIATKDNDIPGKSFLEGTAYKTGKKADTAYNTAEDGQVEIRALSSTVYYFVYGSGKKTVVTEYVGYNNVPKLTAADEAKIEDVYAVGTKTTRESGLGKDNYYTANIVVVEFNAPYKTLAEQVFVIDAPVVGSNVKIDEVEVIRADGTTATVAIDLDNSDIVKDPYGIADNDTVMPGLYYLWETRKEGVYTITPMSHEDIANNKYSVGVVSTALGTLEKDYAGITEYVFSKSWSIDDEMTDEENEYRLTEDSKVFDLSYSWKRGELVADLDADASAKKVLDEHGDRITVEDREWAKNTVLVSYNAKGEIIYAVSFANFDGETKDGTSMVLNFAQYVWDNVKPAGEAVVITDAERAEALLALDEGTWTKEQIEEAGKLVTALKDTDSEKDAELAKKLEERIKKENELASSKDLAAAQEKAVASLKDALSKAIDKADTTNVVVDPYAALSDDTTSFTYFNTKYTLKAIVDAWTKEITNETSVESVTKELDRLSKEVDAVADVYVKAAVEVAEAAAAKAEKTAAVKAAVEKVNAVNADKGDSVTVKNAIAVAVQAAGNAAGSGSFTYSVDLGGNFDAINAGSVKTITCKVTVSDTTINEFTSELTVAVSVKGN